MAIKDQFTPSEWNLLMYAPLWVHSFISIVDGKVDVAEAEVLSKEVQNAFFWRDELAHDVLKEVADHFDLVFKEYVNDFRNPKEGIIAIAALLGSKVEPEMAANFKKALFLIAVRTARASGGWVGSKWVGNSISPEEKKAIEEVALILQIPSRELEEALD